MGVAISTSTLRRPSATVLCVPVVFAFCIRVHGGLISSDAARRSAIKFNQCVLAAFLMHVCVRHDEHLGVFVSHSPFAALMKLKTA